MAATSQLSIFIIESATQVVISCAPGGGMKLEVLEKSDPNFDLKLGQKLRIFSRLNYDPTYTA